MEHNVSKKDLKDALKLLSRLVFNRLAPVSSLYLSPSSLYLSPSLSFRCPIENHFMMIVVTLLLMNLALPKYFSAERNERESLRIFGENLQRSG
jgi:hypothetical protein